MKNESFLGQGIWFLAMPILHTVFMAMFRGSIISTVELNDLFMGVNWGIVSMSVALIIILLHSNSRKENKFLFYIVTAILTSIANTYSFVNSYAVVHEIVIESVSVYATSIFFIVLLGIAGTYATKMIESKDTALAA